MPTNRHAGAGAPEPVAEQILANGQHEAWRDRATDHFDPTTQRFFNPWKDTRKSVTDLLRWWATAARRPWPAEVANTAHPPPPAAIEPGQIALTFIGHASFLARFDGVTLLTDPHFSTHAGLFGRLGTARVRESGLEIDDLPAIDLVFVSHNHYDHLDLPSLQWLDEHRSPCFVTCLGLKRFLEREGLRRVVELDWWERAELGDVTLTVTPSQHWSNRTMLDRDATLWGGCHVAHRDGAALYFAGDSGYAPCFADIHARLGPPGVALLPIGAYEPRWLMRDHHMNPDEAVQAHLDLQARVSVAMHFGFFRLTDEGFDDPLGELDIARRRHGVTEEAFRVLDVGETGVFSSESRQS